MRILVAEDEPLSQLMLRQQLEGWGYEVEMTKTGTAAWDRLRQYDAPSLAILDWEMPGMTGPEICRELRCRPRPGYVYTLLLTCRSGKEDIVAGLDAGADDYLTKPFDAGELQARLRAGRRIVDLQTSLLSACEAVHFPSTLDVTTGLWNREAVLAMLRKALQIVPSQGTPVSVLLFDVDGFSAVRATIGVGADQVLRQVGRQMRSMVRAYDAVGRYAESQFLIVSPGCPPAAANALAERICAAVAAEPVDVLTGVVDVSLSAGVASILEAAEAGAVLIAVEAELEAARRSGSHYGLAAVDSERGGCH